MSYSSWEKYKMVETTKISLLVSEGICEDEKRSGTSKMVPTMSALAQGLSSRVCL